MDKRRDAAKKRPYAQTGGDLNDFDDVAGAYMIATDGTHKPDVKAWIARYPHYAQKLTDLATFTFMTQDATEETSRTRLSPRVQKALDSAFAPQPALAGIIARAQQLGQNAESLAAGLHLSRDVVLMLDSRVIEHQSIPARLKAMLAEALQVGKTQVDAFFTAPAPRTVAAYKSAKAPKKAEPISFAAALSTSKMLKAEDRAYWDEK